MMGTVTNVIPKAQRINDRLLKNDRANLDALDAAGQRIESMRASPEFQHPANVSKLNDLSNQITAQKAVLDDEIAAREQLQTALLEHDDAGAKQARDKLKAIRAAHVKDYGKGESVAVCQKCMDRQLRSIHKVQRPATPEAMADTVTSIFETGEPDYCKISDSPTDAGGLSYGKHQAAEKKGSLHELLTAYVQQSDPAPDSAAKAAIQKHLHKFSSDHDEYLGSPADRAAFKQALGSACTDPAMRQAQDDFFSKNFKEPAEKSADKLCVSSNLGRAMFYDLAVQSGPGRVNILAPKAMKALGKEGHKQCSPCDPEGPDEAAFLDALNDERRSFVENLGGDAAKSTYREDFFDDMLENGNLGMHDDMIVKGIPVKGLPQPSSPALILQ